MRATRCFENFAYKLSVVIDPAMQLAVSVLLRLSEAVTLRRATAQIGDWKPVRHYCHDNVAYWVAHKPEHKHVYGFIYFDHRLLLGCHRLCAHSAVENESGELVDITPHDASADYPFIRHLGTEEEFKLIAARELGQIDIPASW